MPSSAETVEIVAKVVAFVTAVSEIVHGATKGVKWARARKKDPAAHKPSFWKGVVRSVLLVALLGGFGYVSASLLLKPRYLTPADGTFTVTPMKFKVTENGIADATFVKFYPTLACEPSGPAQDGSIREFKVAGGMTGPIQEPSLPATLHIQHEVPKNVCFYFEFESFSDSGCKNKIGGRRLFAVWPFGDGRWSRQFEDLARGKPVVVETHVDQGQIKGELEVTVQFDHD